MPVTDELLLKIITQEENAKLMDDARKRVEAMTDAEKELLKASRAAEQQDKRRSMGLADLKAGFDMVANVGGKVVDFLKDAVDQTVEYAEQVRDLSRAIGANAEEASGLIDVAGGVKISVETLEAAFKTAIKKGIRPNTESLAKLADEYNAIKDPVTRAQFAVDKFGKAGFDMAKLLEEGSDSIRNAAREAKKLGLILSDEDVKAAREFELGLDDMNDKIDAVKLSVGKGLIPVMNDFFDTMSKGLDVLSMATQGFSDIGDATEMKLTASITNAAIAFGTESNVVKELSDQLLNYLIMRQKVAMTEDEAAKRSNIQLAQQQAGTLGLRMARERMIESGNAELDQIMRNNAAIVENSAALERDRVAKEEAAKADAIYRAGISETIGKIDSMAQSLATATDAQAKQMLAQGALDTIRKAQEEGIVSAEGAAKATDAVLLRYGLATEKSLAMAKAQQDINQGLLDGKISLDDYVTSAEKLPKIAADGKVTVKELQDVGIESTEVLKKWNKETMETTSKTWETVAENTKTTIQKTSQQMGQSLDLAKLKLQGVDDLIKSFPDLKIVKLQLDVEVTGDPLPEGVGGARASGGPVSAGTPYLVGERGPEIYIPRDNGYIVPNQSNYNNTTYNVTTDKTGLAYMFERQRQAEMRM